MHPDEFSSPQEQLSASFDGERSGDVDLSVDHQALLRQQWTAIQSSIQSLPVESVDLSDAVAAEVDAVPVVTRVAPLLRRKWMLAVPGVAAIAAVVVFTVIPRLSTPQMQRSVATPRVAQIMKSLRDETNTVGWRLVVVDMPEESAAADQVGSFLDKAEVDGADIVSVHTSAAGDSEYMAGLLLTNGQECQEILNSLAMNAGQIDWDPVAIDGRNPKELKDLLLASMHVPSQSEKMFGAIYVVDHESLAITEEPLPPTPDENSEADIMVAASTEDEESVPADRSQRPAAKALAMEMPPQRSRRESRDSNGFMSGADRRAPVVIIFRYPEQKSNEHPGSDPGQDGALHPSTATVPVA